MTQVPGTDSMPEKHQDALKHGSRISDARGEYKELTEEEVKLLRKKERASEHDNILYLFDTIMISLLLKSIHDTGRVIPEIVFNILNAVLYTHGMSKMSRFYEDDMTSYLKNFFYKIIHKGYDPKPLLRKIAPLIQDRLNKIDITPRSFTSNKNHVLISSNEFPGEESDTPQKIIIYRSRKNKISAQKRTNKRNILKNNK